MSRLKIDSPRVPQTVRSPERKDVSIAVPRPEAAPGLTRRDAFDAAQGAQRRPLSAGGSLFEPASASATSSGTGLSPSTITLAKEAARRLFETGQHYPEPQAKRLLRTDLKNSGLLGKELKGAVDFAYGEYMKLSSGGLGTTNEPVPCAFKLAAGAGEIFKKLPQLGWGELKKEVKSLVHGLELHGKERREATRFVFGKLAELGQQNGSTRPPAEEKPFRILPHQEPQLRILPAREET